MRSQCDGGSGARTAGLADSGVGGRVARSPAGAVTVRGMRRALQRFRARARTMRPRVADEQRDGVECPAPSRGRPSPAASIQPSAAAGTRTRPRSFGCGNGACGQIAPGF